MNNIWIASLLSASICLMGVSPAAAFVHPGLFYTRADLDRMKAQVGAGREPWVSGYKLLAPNLDYKPQPVLNETIGTGQFQIRADAGAAKSLAIAWFVTGDLRYAQASMRIIDAWASTMQSFDPADNLSASEAIQGFGEAAEILIYTGKSGWSAADIARYRSMMLKQLYPAVAKAKTDGMMGNQGIDAVMAAMAVGIALDIPQYFQDGITAWAEHPCVAVQNFILPSGQNGETSRDQPHSADELVAANRWALLAWNQGVDLYGTAENRLLAGFEYWARYNLGYDVPFTPFQRCNYGHGSISDRARGRLGTVDLSGVYRHYVTEKGLRAPFVKQAIERVGATADTFLSYAGPALTSAPVLADGNYTIVSRLNAMALSTLGDSILNGTPIDLEPDTGRPSQVWTFTRYAGNVYRLINAAGKATDVPGSDINPGIRVNSHTPNGSLSQFWRLGRNPDGTYYFLNAKSSWGMSIQDGNTSVGASIEQNFLSAAKPSYEQEWLLHKH